VDLSDNRKTLGASIAVPAVLTGLIEEPSPWP